MKLFASMKAHLLGLVGLLSFAVAAPAMAQTATDTKTPAKPAGLRVDKAVPRGAIITMGDRDGKNMVGVYMTAGILERIMPLLEEEKIDLVVFRFYSGGGMLLEIQPLSDIIENQYKRKFRSVAWIESAISAAAMTAHTFNDIYFTSQANYGACTGFAGSLDRPVTGPELERVLAMMEKISARGGHDPRIMRAMQISSDDSDVATLKIDPPSGALSANIDDKTGDVTFYQDTSSGKFVLNPEAGRRILTFNSESAAKFKFSSGTADTLPELAQRLGYKEVEWVGEKVPAILWPVCKAEKKNMDFRNRTKVDEEMNATYYRQFVMHVQAAQGAQTREERLKFLAKARGGLDKLEQMLKNNPNLALSVMQMFPDDARKWLEERRKLLKDLAK